MKSVELDIEEVKWFIHSVEEMINKLERWAIEPKALYSLHAKASELFNKYIDEWEKKE